MLEKPKTFRSEKYLDFVRSHPCCVCKKTPVEAHHIIGIGNGIMSSKESDCLTLPLCNEHHREVHSGKSTIDQLNLYARFMREAFDKGAISLTEK
jgi:hypothetical protein